MIPWQEKDFLACLSTKPTSSSRPQDFVRKFRQKRKRNVLLSFEKTHRDQRRPRSSLSIVCIFVFFVFRNERQTREHFWSRFLLSVDTLDWKRFSTRESWEKSAKTGLRVFVRKYQRYQRARSDVRVWIPACKKCHKFCAQKKPAWLKVRHQIGKSKAPQNSKCQSRLRPSSSWPWRRRTGSPASPPSSPPITPARTWPRPPGRRAPWPRPVTSSLTSGIRAKSGS